ncbi:MAG: nuclear transport factor 2 family protein, partial [Saprospiraceae bacterium]|nr:nuclear transport factor 2 family protein [Saprospiraceae bacterium]
AARWDEFVTAWERKDAVACAGFYTEDARHIPPNSEVNTGRSAIASFYETLFLDNAGSRYEHTIESVDIAGDHAIERGRFEVVWTGLDSTSWTFSARSLTHWVVQDGEWQIRQLMFNLPPQQ